MDAMPLYRVHICADASEPIPLPDTLPAVEAEDPFSAVEKLLADGRYPQTPGIKWARVAVTYHPDGSIRHVVRVPINADLGPALEWGNPVMGELSGLARSVVRQISI